MNFDFGIDEKESFYRALSRFPPYYPATKAQKFRGAIQNIA